MSGLESTDNSIRVRQKNPKKYAKMRTISITEGVRAVIGFPKDGGSSEVQTYIFDNSKFDMKTAKEWVKKHKTKLQENFGVSALKLEYNVDITNGTDLEVTEMKPDNKTNLKEEVTLSSPGTSRLPNEMNNDYNSTIPDDIQELFPDVRFSNGKPNREKAVTYLQQIGAYSKFMKDSDVKKLKRLLYGILKESYHVILNESGFNLQEGESSFVADDFDIKLVEGIKDSSVRKAKVRLIQSGESKNGNIYSGPCLREAAPLFEGLPIYPNHIDGERKVEEKVGWYSDVKYIGDDNSGELQAVANIFESEPKMWDLVKEQYNNPNAKICGFSINAFGKGKTLQEDKGGKKRRVVESIVYADSTDIVDNPSAGGKVLELLESVKTTYLKLGEDEMDLKTLKEKHADLVKLIEDECKASLKEAKDSDGDDDAVCPSCKKKMKAKESVEHANEHVKDLESKLSEAVTKLSEASTKVSEMERSLSINSLKESIQEKLASHKSLPEALKTRLVEGLLNAGPEKREGDKPSNWDAFIEGEINYVNQFKGSNPLVLGSEQNKVTSTETVKLTEKEMRETAASISRVI